MDLEKVEAELQRLRLRNADQKPKRCVRTSGGNQGYSLSTKVAVWALQTVS
jgi:hypothetical protein